MSEDEPKGWCRYSRGFFGTEHAHRNQAHLRIYPKCETKDLITYPELQVGE